MPKTRPSPQGQKVLDLRKSRPDISAKEIADELKISAPAVYQAETRLREQGHLPKLRKHAGRGSRPRARQAVREVSVKQVPNTKVEVPTNGSRSLEDVAHDEKSEVETRLTEIAEQFASLNSERDTLASRKRRLEAVENALTAQGDEFDRIAPPVEATASA